MNETFEIDHQPLKFHQIKLNLENKSIHLEQGGIFLANKNNPCMSNRNVAIIIPYRDRSTHLKLFINNIHIFLSRQRMNYGIYIIEQFGQDDFNRGLLINIGFLESIKDSINNQLNVNWNCFIFHDVDFIPQNGRNIYKCSDEYPLHLASYPEQGFENLNW